MKKTVVLFLAFALLLGLAAPAFAFSAVLSEQNLSVNGIPVTCEKYNIDGSNYFKLRDLAQHLNGTGSQFDVGWDGEKGVVSITTNSPYTTPNGTELVMGGDQSDTAQPSAQTIMIDGAVRSDLTVFNIGGSNFFKLRELGEALGFDVDFDAGTNTAIVTSRGYEVPQPPAGPQPAEEPAIALDQVAFSLIVGETMQLTAVVTPEGTPVTWISGDPAIATVDANGLVTAISAGMADIRAEAGELGTFCTVTVVPGTITLDQVAVSLKPGETARLTATVTPDGAPVTWTSGDPAIATVDVDGLVTAVAGGAVDIYASAAGTETFCTVTVTDVFTFLKNKAINEGYYQDGTYYCDINWQYVDNFYFLFSYGYSTESGQVLVRAIVKDSTGETTMYFPLSEGLPLPYRFSFAQKYYPDPSWNCNATGSFYPSQFTATDGTIKYDTFYGRYDRKEGITSLITIAIIKSFAILDVNVLLDNGYQLSDLGFTNPLYGPEDL